MNSANGYEPSLTPFTDPPGTRGIDAYRARGGYAGLAKGLARTPEEVIEEVKRASLRGRGGAGFPAGVKWSFMPKEKQRPHFLLVNADEGEPGTFKDRLLLEQAPHLVLEGCLIAAYAIRAETVYIYLRGEFTDAARILDAAIAEIEQAGLHGDDIAGSGFDCRIRLHLGAGAYICGEETAMIESLEGKRGYPRRKPPFPAQSGFLGYPSTVNNVETLACVPQILGRGADWFAGIGTTTSPGPKLYCVSGRVRNPGVYELPMSATVREVVETAGGPLPGRKIAGVLPGGASSGVLTPDELDLTADFDTLNRAGTMLGSAGMMVFDDATCPVSVMTNLLRFFAHETCGQCTPCREGVPWAYRIARRIESGEGKPDDPDRLLEMCSAMCGHTICVLPDGASMPTRSIVTKFRDVIDRHRSGKGCPFPAGGSG